MDGEQLELWTSLVAEGVSAREQRDGAQWVLGDLADKVETQYGELSLKRFADEIGVTYSALLSYRTVSRAYPDTPENSTRVENLSWSHHRAVASSEERESLLEKAEAREWPVSRLLTEVAPAEDIQLEPVMPRGTFGTGENEWYTP